MSSTTQDQPSFNQRHTRQLMLGTICKDTYIGADKVKKYLIKPVSESDIEYEGRQNISAIATTFKKGIDSFTDILFKNPLRYSEDVPDKIVEYYKTANGSDSLNEMAKGAFKESLLMNAVYWLVWTPDNTASNAREEEQLGIRPYIEEITLENIISIRRDSLGNLSMVIVAGTYVAEEGRYEDVEKAEYRVYFASGEVEIWREAKTGDEIEMYDTIMLDVPEMPIVELRYETQDETPAFINEAKLQLEQYNIESARFSYNIKLGFPMVTTWGLLQNSKNVAIDSEDSDGNPVKIVQFQSSKGIDFPVNPETGSKLGDIEFKEISGDSDSVLKGTSEDYTTAIMDGFISLITSTSGNKTVAEAENERAAGESTLSSASSNLEDFLNRVHSLFCKYAGIEPVGEIYTNTEFVDDDLDSLEYQLLTDLLAESVIDKRQFLEELQSYGKLQTVDIDALMDRLTAVGYQ